MPGKLKDSFGTNIVPGGSDELTCSATGTNPCELDLPPAGSLLPIINSVEVLTEVSFCVASFVWVTG